MDLQIENEAVDENGVASMFVALGEYAEEMERERQLQGVQMQEGSEFGTQVEKSKGTSQPSVGDAASITSHKHREISNALKYKGHNNYEKKQSNTKNVAHDPVIHKLHFAAKNNDISTINYCIESAYDLDIEDSSSANPLLIAVIYENYDAARILQQEQIDKLVREVLGPDAISNPSYLYHKRQVEISHTNNFVSKLFDKKFNSERIGKVLAEIKCILSIVVEYHDPVMTKSFLQYCNEDNNLLAVIPNNMHGFDLEHIRVLITCEPESQERKRDFVWALVQNIRNYEKTKEGRDFVGKLSGCEFLDEEFFALLDRKFLGISMKTTKLFFKYGFHTVAKAKYGQNITSNLFGNRDRKVIRWLKNQRIDIDERFCNKNSLLHIASRHYVPQNIRLLLDKEADPNGLNEEEDTPLSLAIKGAKDQLCYTEESIKLLLLGGANIMAINHQFEGTFFGFDLSQIIGNEDRCYEMNIIKLLVVRLAIYEAVGISIEPSIREFMASGNNELETYFEKCCQQLEALKMRTIFVTPNAKFSIFTILAERPEKLAQYVNEERLQMIENFMKTYSKRSLNVFYYELLRRQLKIITQIRLHRKKAVQVVCHFTGIEDPDHLVVQKIVGYFTIKDLLIFKDNR